MTEFDQLEESLVFGTVDTDGDTTVDPASLNRLENEYQEFCDSLPEDFDVSRACLCMGDEYTQFAHDYVMTRMGHGVGFWEDNDWEETAGNMLTIKCKAQGALETYVSEGVVFIY